MVLQGNEIMATHGPVAVEEDSLATKAAEWD